MNLVASAFIITLFQRSCGRGWPAELAAGGTGGLFQLTEQLLADHAARPDCLCFSSAACPACLARKTLRIGRTSSA